MSEFNNLSSSISLNSSNYDNSPSGSEKTDKNYGGNIYYIIYY